jgi:hypothetical protein
LANINTHLNLAAAIKDKVKGALVGTPFDQLACAVSNLMVATALSKPEQPPTCTRALLKDQAIAQLAKDPILIASDVFHKALNAD